MKELLLYGQFDNFDGNRSFTDSKASGSWYCPEYSVTQETSSPINSETGAYAQMLLNYGQLQSPTISLDLESDFELSFYGKRTQDMGTSYYPAMVGFYNSSNNIILKFSLSYDNMSKLTLTNPSNHTIKGPSLAPTWQGRVIFSSWHKYSVKKVGNQWSIYFDDVLQVQQDFPNFSTGIVSYLKVGRNLTEALNAALNCIDEVKLALDMPNKRLYKTNTNKVYGFSNGSFGVVVNDWTGLSDAEKVSAFETYGLDEPTASDLATITNPFRVLTYFNESNTPTAKLTAVPNHQIVTPKGLIPLSTYAALTKVEANVQEAGNGSIKMAVTKDLLTYKVYDTNTSTWVNVASSDIPNSGMTAAELAAIPDTAWAVLDATGLGIAYSLSQSTITDKAEVDALTLTVDMAGELESQVHGTDYDYSYASNTILKVKLYKDGDFKINYNPGES